MPDEFAIIEGKSRLKARRASRQTITDDQVEAFFETLAETCNVVRSAKAAGFTANWAYRKRKFDAAFRDGWAAALAEGYAKLELILLERAIKGTPKLVRASGGKDRIMRDYSPTLAICLLRRHADTARKADEWRPPDDGLDEVREAILERLERMRQREMVLRDETSTGSASPQDERFVGIETKGWVGRIGLIEWGLAFRAQREAPPPCCAWPPSPSKLREDL